MKSGPQDRLDSYPTLNHPRNHNNTNPHHLAKPQETPPAYDEMAIPADHEFARLHAVPLKTS